ncbi:MAG: P-loop NTPase fold protein [Prosthecobacter sp.]
MSNSSTAYAEQDAYRSALGLIETCFIQKSPALNLSGLGLAVLPPEIGKLSFLEQLILSENKLSELPLEFSYLKNLKTCDLRQNRFTSFPLKLCKLTDLEVLLISYNQIEVLPPEIGMLSKLRRLGVRNNRISELPPEIGKLTELVELGVENNRLWRLPHELEFLEKLEMLFLHENPDLEVSAEILGPTWAEVYGDRDLGPANPAALLNYYFASKTESQPSDSSRDQAEKLERIVFPSIQFQNATIAEAVEYLRVRSWDLDDGETDRSKRGVNLVLDRNLSYNNASLSLDLQNVPMVEALRYITELAGVTYEVKPDEIRVTTRPIGSPEDGAASPSVVKTKQRVGAARRSVATLSRAQTEGDNPSVEDHFGRERFVETLGYFLTRPKTGTPLTVSIEAPWGAGKSSFMRQLESQVLRNQLVSTTTTGLLDMGKRWLKNKFVKDSPITMWFNPWRHAEAEAMWAAFALEFARRIRQQSVFFRRWGWAQFSLWWQSYDWSRGLPEFVRLASRMMVLCLAGLIFWFAWKYGMESLKGVCHSVGEWAKLDKDHKTAAALVEKLITGETGTLAVAVVTVMGLVLQLSSALGNPLVPAIRRYLTKQDSAGKLGYVEGFQKQFGQMVRAYAGKRRVFVFVDDLDRCEVAKAASLMQSINLMLGDPDLNAVFLLGMDREKVAAGMAVKHESLLPYLNARELLGQLEGNGTQPKNIEALQHLLGLEFGYSFIEKFIQLPFRLPQPGDEGMERYLCNLTGRAYVRGEAARRATQVRDAANKAPIGEGDVSKGETPEHDVGQGPGDSNRRNVEQSAPAAAAPKRVEQHTQDFVSRAKERVERFQRLAKADQLQTEDSLFEALLLIRPALDDNPRKLKLALNLLRLHGFLASDWLANPPPQGEPGPRITLPKLAKVIAMDLRWPTYLLSLAEKVSDMRMDEKIPAHSSLPPNDPELASLLERGGGHEVLSVADLRAILSVAPAPNAADSEMIEMIADAEFSEKSDEVGTTKVKSAKRKVAAKLE